MSIRLLLLPLLVLSISSLAFAQNEQASQNQQAGQGQRTQEQKSDLSKPVSDSFPRDLLTDADGVNFHRFQMVIWTIVPGGSYVYGVYRELAMPEFSATLNSLDRNQIRHISAIPNPREAKLIRRPRWLT